MTQSDYLKIILDGHFYNKKHLDSYLYRESKNAEIKHTKLIEFFDRLIDEVDKFEHQIEHDYEFQLNRHNLTEEYWEDNGKDVKLLENQKPIFENCSLNVLVYTKGQFGEQFRGQLSHYDIAFIRQSISIAMDKIKAEIKQTIGRISNDIEQSPAIDLIFNNKTNAFEVFLELLEDLEITIGGITQMKKGRAGKLTGLISAIKETPHMLKIENPAEDQLLGYFNDYLKTSYKTFPKRSKDYQSSFDDAKRYIKNHFKK